VVLMDVRMPKMTGVEATRQILARDPDARIVMLTSSVPTAAVLRALDAGALLTAHKDIEPGDLVRAIHAVARGDAADQIGALPSDAVLLRSMVPTPEEPSPRLGADAQDVLALLCKGRKYAEIALERGTAESSAKKSAQRLRTAFGVQTNEQLIARAIEYGYATV
jgi:DNA-binding NarL/FixJ family response regulator